MRPRVLLADDHVMFAQALSRILEPAVEIVGMANDGGQLVESVSRLRPDVVIADVSMPVMTGLDAMRQLKARGIESKFIFLTLHGEPRLASEALRAGARGYLLKEAAAEELLAALSSVVAGRTYLTPRITQDVLQEIAAPSDDMGSRLTPRQRDVLRLIAQGKRMKEIAAELDISVRTVANHKYEMMHALGVETTADLIKFAIKEGIARA
jgi:two-component system, NarL family, response regulator NreC